MNINLNTYAVRANDGSIDLDATVSKFEGDVSTYVALQAADQEKVAEAVATVFDTNMGTNINMPFLVSQALPLLGVSASTHKSLSERVLAYVRSNADGKGSNLFSIVKGIHGGVKRLSDVPATEETAK